MIRHHVYRETMQTEDWIEDKLGRFLQQLAREGIRFDVVRPRTIRQSEVDANEEGGPLDLAGVESFSGSDIFQVLLVGPDQERLLSALKPVAPFLKGQLDRQKLPIAYITVLFSWREKAQG